MPKITTMPRQTTMPRRSILLTLLSLSLVATAAQAQPTISKIFNSNTIGPGSVSTAIFTIDNTGGGGPVSDLAFTDVLPTVPGDVDIATPPNASTTCNIAPGGAGVTAPAGGGTISFSDGQIGAGASCTISVDVTASTPGVHTNPAITLTSSAGSSMSLPIDLTVVTTLPGFSKSFAPSSVPLGDKSTLTFTIDNTANASRVGSLDFTDNLPAGMVVADPANASTDCISASAPNTTVTAVPGTSVIILDANGNTIFAGFEVLPAGGTCTVTVDVVSTGVGMLDNVTNDLLADFTSSGKASDILEVTRTDLAIQKAFTDDPVPPGSAVTLDFTINNFDRNFSATSVAFTDDLTTVLAGLTFSSLLSNDCGGSVSGVGGTTIGLTGGTVAAEGSCSISVSLSVPAGATPGSYPNTTSTVTATVNGSPVVGNMASADLFVEPVPQLTKTFVGSPIEPGDTIQLDFTVTNSSATSSATDITFSDAFAAVIHTASVTPGNGCCGAGSICSFTPIFIPPPPSSVVPATLTISDGVLAPAGMAGDSCNFSITLDVLPDTPPGVYPNTTSEITATVDGATRLGDPASDSFTVISAPRLDKIFTDPVPPGGATTLDFTLTYPQDASGDATGITFTDDLAALAPALAGLIATGLPITEACDPDGPGGNPGTGTLSGSVGDTLLTFLGGTLSPGESCTISVPISVPMAAAPGNYTNTSSGVGAMVGGVPVTSAAASDVLNVSGLMFSKEFLGDPVIAGDFVTLRFTIDNIHPTDDATITFFNDSLSTTLSGLAAVGGPSVNTCGGVLSGTTSLTYVGGGVLAGASCTIEVDLLVPGGAADGVYSNLTSFLSATQSGGAVVVDPAADNLTVTSTLLQLTKEFTDDPVAPGDTVNMRLILTNIDATNAASAIAFVDDLGASLTGANISSIVETCGGTISGMGTDTLTVSGVALAAGAFCQVDVGVDVPGATAAGIYSNTTTSVTGTIGGFAVTGTPATGSLDVIQLLGFSKSFDGPTTATGMATLTFTLTNPGTDTASDLFFSDDLNAVIPGLIAIGLPALPCGAGSSITGISFLSFTGGTLPPAGGMCSFDVDVLVPASATAGVFPNTTSDLFRSGLTVAEPAIADLTIEPPPAFSKAFAPAFIGFGQTSTLTFTLDNSGSSLAATSLAFTDTLPAGVAVATPAVTSNTCGGTLTATAGSGVISLTGGSVGATAACTIDVDVVGSAVGALVNTTGDLTSSSGNSGTATDTLTVNPQPGFAKVFSPDPILVGGTSTLTFTVDNTASTVAASLLAYTDTLPAAITLATPVNSVNGCGGTLTAVDGGTSVTLSGGTAALGSMCTISVDVTSSTTGTHTNTSSNLTSSLGTSGTASDTLTVNPPPTFAKVFSPDPIIFGATSTLTFTIDNTASTVAATALAFTDNLPAAIVVTTPANNANACGGTLTAAAGTSVVTLSGGTVAASASCTITVDVTSSTAGTHTNLTDDLTSSLGNSGTATDSLTVNPPPTFAKSFAPDPIAAGGTSTLTFTIDNSASTVDATTLAFTDNLPAGLTIASPANTANTCGGTVTAASGTGVVSLSGGLVTTGASCVLSVDVTGSTAGDFVNLTGDLTSSLGNSGTATDTLRVNMAPTFTKAFAPNPILVGGTSTLTFTIDNSTSTAAATSLDFSDTMPTEIGVATPSNATTTCTGGTLTAASGTSDITYTGGTVSAMASCTVTVDVTSTTAGSHVNLTGDLTSSLGTSGTATDTLTVNPPPTFAKVFSPNPILVGAVTTLTFTIDNSTSTVDATSVDFTDNLPAAVVVATPANTTNTCTGGTLTAASATSVVSYTGGTVSALSSCTITVDVTSSTPGSHVNLTGDLTSSLGNSGTAADTLVVNSAPGFTKVFAPNPSLVGTASTLTFTIDNTANTVDAASLDFTDNLPAGLVVFTPSSAATTCTGGTLTAAAGSSVITYTGGTAPAMSTCTITVDVTSAMVGSYVNLTGDLTSSLGNSGTATDTLVVNMAPSFMKVFAPNPIGAGGVTTLTFTIDNSTSTLDATAVDFTDTFPAGLVVATPSGAATTCIGGTLTASAGSGSVTYTGGTVTAMTMCTISVDVTAAAAGDFVNTTGDLTSSLGNSGSATDTLNVLNGELGMTKMFVAGPILPGGMVDLEYTVSNMSSMFTATGITFMDDFDSALPGLAAAGLPPITPDGGDPCGAGSTVTGSSVLTLAGGTLAPSSSCTFTVTLIVPATAADGMYTSTSGPVSADISGVSVTGPAATSDFSVAFLEFSKVFFGEATPGSLIGLEFTINNPDPVNPVTDIFFTDDLDAVLPGLEAVDLPLFDVCGVGSDLSGTSVITLMGGNLGPSGSCTFVATVQIPTTAADGTFTNITSILEAAVGGAPVAGDPAGAAMADITISNALEIPTLGQWGLMLLIGMLAVAAVRRLQVG